MTAAPPEQVYVTAIGARGIARGLPRWLTACALGIALTLLTLPTAAVEAGQVRAHVAKAKPKPKPRIGLGGNKAVGGPPRPAADSSGDSEAGVIDAGFENGLDNWNTAGVGEVVPGLANDTVRTGAWSGRFALNGSQDRSELILGGNGNGSVNDAIRFYEGSEHYYAFSFYIHSMTYGEPGAHNLIMQLKGTDEGSPYFGLQLWDYEGDDGDDGGRGLWSHGEGMDGDRFLSPVAERSWHDVVIHFRASAHGDGFYTVYLDGALLDHRDRITLIPPGADHDYIKSGLYRNGSEIPGSAEIRLDAVRLGPDLAAVGG